jgi:tetratricopeptide (TPR) repeat protein
MIATGGNILHAIQPGTITQLTRDTNTIGKELGVDFVLDGSIIYIQGRTRVSAQLTETAHGEIVWQEQYNSELSDFFQVSSRIGANIGNAIGFEILEHEEQSQRGLTTEPDLVLALARAMYQSHTLTRDGFAKGIKILNEARAKYDDKYELIDRLAMLHINRAAFELSENPKYDIERGLEFARTAFEMSPRSAGAHITIGWALQCNGDAPAALNHYNQAIELEPNAEFSRRMRCQVHIACNLFDEARRDVETAMMLSPKSAYRHVDYIQLGLINFCQGNIDAAIAAYERSINLRPNYFFAHASLAACMFEKNDIGRAKQHLEIARPLAPNTTKQTYFQTLPGLDKQYQHRFIDALRQLGWDIDPQESSN